MALDLDGKQRRELRLALLDAYPSWADLRQMIADQLDENLAAITAQAGNLSSNVFDLIEWAKARGLLAVLVIGARNQNPGNPFLEEFAGKLSLSAERGIAAGVLQKVVSSNNVFLDVAKWRAQLARSEWCVCRVDCDGEGVGSGFLVGADLVLTNYHVVEDLVATPAQLPRWSCRFDHKLSEAGDVISMGRMVKLAAADWCVDCSKYSDVDLVPDPKPGDPGEAELDFALIRLAEKIGDASIGKSDNSDPRSWIAMTSDAVDFPSQKVIAILQHPLTRPMKLALSLEQKPVLAGAKRRVRYTVPTEEGSSGSPVFDGDWRLIALHHSGDPRIAQPLYNEAIPIALITARPKVAAALA